MPYQIERKTVVEDCGKIVERETRLSQGGWTITLATEDDARKVLDIVYHPDEAYILAIGEVDRPRFYLVEGGSTEGSKPLAEVIELLGESDYYRPDGTKRPDSEIY
jgi:hypothetical protein